MIKKTLLPVALFASLLALAPAAFAQSTPAKIQGDAKRGAYIEKLGDCTACHTAPGHDKFAGGLPLNSPIGIIYTTNITPDPDHGIGRYTLKDFGSAMREGIARDGHHLYPAMPYANFAAISDQDIADLYAYFMTGVKPSTYDPPKTNLMFPLNQRWGLRFWNFLFSSDKFFTSKNDFKSQPGQDAQWNRGAYIVRTLAHCSACHTPRNIFYGEKSYTEASSSFLSGNTIDGWQAINLRGDAHTGLKDWSADDIAAFLKTGHGNGATAIGAMQQVVEESTQYLSDNDLDAIAHYIKSLPPEKEVAAKPHATSPPDFTAYPRERPGAGLYTSQCAGCHKANGTGRPPAFPALAGNPVLMSQDPVSLVHIIIDGGTAARTKTGPRARSMPAFDTLTDSQIADIITYIRTSWGNAASPVSEAQVKAFRAQLAKDDAAKDKATKKAAEKKK